MDSNERIRTALCLLTSIVFTIVSLGSYVASGYHSYLFVIIAFSLLLGGIAFYQPNQIKFFKKDFWYISLLLLIVAPIYLYHFDAIPLQINTDEITIMTVSKEISQNQGIDILGPSNYLGFAAFIFYVFGKISTFLGGIDLYHFRLVHTLSGIAISLAAYGFFRQLVDKRGFALVLAIWLASNHALFAISRMAMRDNTGLLIELACLTLLIYGWKNKNNIFLFMGGVIGGLSFYTYFPARITMIFWFLFAMAALCVLPNPPSLKETFKKLLISFYGFFVIVPYMLIATGKQADAALHYSRQQFLFYPEGRELQQEWINARTPLEGWITNITNGLSTFNNTIHDLGYIYPNYGHGFVDPLTGILLWAGVIIILWRWFKYGMTFNELFGLFGFTILYLSFAFLITKAPNYTRLFVILPFVIYLAGQGGVFVAKILSKQNPLFKTGILTGIVISVIAWNGMIFKDYIRIGETQGNDVGSTARYILARQNEAGHSWILAADNAYPYYSWGDNYGWRQWFGFFAGPTQHSQVVSLNELRVLDLNKSHTILLSKKAWEDIYADLSQRYPKLHVDSITPNGKYLAVEID